MEREKPVSVRLPRDMQEAIKILAQRHIRSVNGEIIHALKLYISDQAEHTQKEQKEES